MELLARCAGFSGCCFFLSHWQKGGLLDAGFWSGSLGVKIVVVLATKEGEEKLQRHTDLEEEEDWDES